jgi:hypothetical protein
MGRGPAQRQLANEAQCESSGEPEILTLPSSFNFVPSPALTQDLKEQIETSLNDFQRHLASLGFGGDAGIVSVEITPGSVVERKEGPTSHFGCPKRGRWSSPVLLRPTGHRCCGN